MNSIKKNNSSFWMVGSFLIILVIFLLLLSKTPMVITKDFIDFREVVALVEALDEDNQHEEAYDLLREKYTDESNSTTYGMLKETLDILGSADGLADEIMKKNPKDKYIEKDQFYSFYENWIEKLGKGNEIKLEKVVILDVFEGATNENGYVLVTEKEVGTCEGEFFTEYKGYVTNTYVKRVGQEIRYITIKEIEDEKIELTYAYVKGQDGEGLHFQIQESEVILPYEDGVKVDSDVIANLTIEKGKVINVKSFQEKINGKVLAVNDTYVTLENLGKYEFAENMKIYKVFEGLSEGNIADVALGYEFVDFVLEDNKVCACLIVANEGMEYIRVLIKTTDFASNYHKEIVVSCDFDYTIYKNGEEYKKCQQSEETVLSKDDMKDGEVIKFVPDILSGKVKVKSIKRNQGEPSYGGVMEVHKKEEGLVLINEVLLEEYLYTVVPSEMPAYYQKQALMAQAVCARTYAYTKMQNAGIKNLGAHLDDSTSFQVYNNIDAQISTTNAVRDTVGQIVAKDGRAFETMYYSTSCGLGSTGLRLNKSDSIPANITSNEAFSEYIQSINENDYEAQEAFYRWTYKTSLDTEMLEKRIEECYNKIKENVLYLSGNSQFDTKDKFADIGKIQNLFVAERSSGGRAEKLVVTGSKNTVMICGEYHIRSVLLNEEKVIKKQDGTTVSMSALLPSAFIEIETEQTDGYVTEYKIFGGGYGHGNGMSQNGAGNMAKDGYSYTDILTLFYENCTIEQIY